MRRAVLARELKSIALGSSICLGLGYIAGHALLGLCAALAWFLFRQLKELSRLRHWLLATEQAVPESDGAWDDVFRDIYLLRRNERRARDNLLSIIDRARSSVSALDEAVALIDNQGNLEWWNPAAETLLGFRPEDRGQPVINLVRAPSFIRYFKQNTYDEDLKVASQRHAGRQLQFEITQFGDNDRLMIVYDITRLHNLEQMRKDFVANVSHELRTPLTVLSGYLETLLDQPEGIEPRWLRALGQMSQQATRMNNLVNDLLLLSRLENQPEDREPSTVSVPKLLKQIHQDALALAAPKQQTVTLECEPGLCLLGIENDLRSAFSNLVTNAVKYTPNAGIIAVRWWSDSKGAYFSVSDNGLGIDEIHLSRLTERFYRADAARRTATGGTGLGLAIVKHVLMQHKATLDIHSEIGRGSRFTCSFMPSHIERELES